MLGRSLMRGLYAICDLDALAARDWEPVAYVRELLKARPGALQLRAKNHGAREILRLLEALQPLCRSADVPLFANDRPDLASLAGVCGVHLGQEDVPVADVRRLSPELRVGLSTHSIEQLEAGLRLEPDYVALGPIFPTQSKHNAEPAVGLEQLEQAARRCRGAGVPLVAIGGITQERFPDVMRSADMVALISALMPEELSCVQERAELFV